MSEEPLIHMRNCHKAFGDLKVLDGLDLKIYPNQITVIIGKSGMGKSVLLKHIIGLMRPDSGEILIEGQDLWKMKRPDRQRLLGKISYLFQGTALFDFMTVFENIALPLVEKTKLSKNRIRDKVHHVMEILDLPPVFEKYPSQISGGMRKRVALARALVTDPEILLFDEPTTGLDPIRKISVLNMISDYHTKLGFTGVLVSHAVPDVLYISQRVAYLNDGKILFQGNPLDILHLENPEVEEFFRGVDNSCVNLALLRSLTEGEGVAAERPVQS